MKYILVIVREIEVDAEVTKKDLEEYFQNSESFMDRKGLNDMDFHKNGVDWPLKSITTTVAVGDGPEKGK